MGTKGIEKLTQINMDVEKVLHMTGGDGDTSYAKNSAVQKNASDMVKHIPIEVIQQVYRSITPNSMGIADLGCSSGPNTLSIIKDLVSAVQATCEKPPEFRVYLNDLPTNDFNSIFKTLPEFYKELIEKENDDYYPSIFIGTYPGSFYKRIVPNNCLHFVYSSYSLHWLSRVPPGVYDDQGKPINKGNVYISNSSPPEVSQAYEKQFKDDFFTFLRCRSEELSIGGKMVLIFLGRSSLEHVDRGSSLTWQVLARSLALLVSKGGVEKEKFDSYDVPYYAPSKEEIEDAVRKEGSFELNQLEIFQMEKINKPGLSYGMMMAMAVRAFQESMICHHFGEGTFLDDLFEIYGKMMDEEVAKEEQKTMFVVAVLNKL